MACYRKPTILQHFHAEQVAMAAENLALAIVGIGAQSERRLALLIDASLS